MQDTTQENFSNKISQTTNSTQSIWDLGIKELTGHNIETHGREEVNKLLKEGWILLHIYTLKYKEDGTWRERPMAILGKPETDN